MDIYHHLDDPAASRWFKEALSSAMQRDCVDAARDARRLAAVLDVRCSQMLGLAEIRKDAAAAAQNPQSL